MAEGAGLTEPDADAMIENVIGLHALPLGVALNFVVNGVERLVPMAVEEPSIVAACSYAARLVAASGGFEAVADAPLVAGQVHLHQVPDLARACAAVGAHEKELLDLADSLIPRMRERGGGAREVEVRPLAPDALCVHLLVDCRDAMGANLVNTVAEGVAPALAELTRRPGGAADPDQPDGSPEGDGAYPSSHRGARIGRVSRRRPWCATPCSTRSGAPSSTPTGRPPTTRAS